MAEPRSEEVLVRRVLDEPALEAGVTEVLVDGQRLIIALHASVDLGHLEAAFISINSFHRYCQMKWFLGENIAKLEFVAIF